MTVGAGLQTLSRAQQTAVRFMQAGAALSAAGIMVDLGTVGSFRAAIMASYPNYAPDDIHRVELVTLGGAVVVGAGYRLVDLDGTGDQVAPALGPRRRHRAVRAQHAGTALDIRAAAHDL
jgi:hypothetical protein